MINDMKYYITNIRRGKGNRKEFIYAELRNENHELVISSTIGYIVDAVAERGYELINMESKFNQIKNRLNQIKEYGGGFQGETQTDGLSGFRG